MFRQELIAVARPHLIGDLPIPLTTTQLRYLPVLHDSHNHWPRCLLSVPSLRGSRFEGGAVNASYVSHGFSIGQPMSRALNIRSTFFVVGLPLYTILDYNFQTVMFIIIIINHVIF